jgi:hypothetical protein
MVKEKIVDYYNVLPKYSLPESDNNNEIHIQYSRSGFSLRTSRRKIDSSPQYSVPRRSNGLADFWIIQRRSFSYIGFVASNSGVIVNGVFEGMLKEVVVTYFKILSQRMLGLSVASGTLSK